MIAIALAATVMFADAPATAPAPTVQPVSAPASTGTGMLVDKKSNDFVCKNEPVLGSRLTKKVCRSRSQAEDEKSESRETLSQIQRLSSVPKAY
ncbi:hypothetical protein [Phenylobacterium soli]|uniref:Uncharacterized protein n=1 Tax=Phenylobacterium soli TaxID=2170551 RepID=A0A328AI22_9CAUL|nr:hypothetical protein [Phenylobacterium soli]RAK54462.1 hypothetical protein DJ017_07970 [Phenylobacterium soli]